MSFSTRRPIAALLLCLAVLGAAGGAYAATSMLNVSYDPTREFYVAYNAAFTAYWKKQSGEDVTIQQSHGGSGKQARTVIDGLEADVVTLGIPTDIDAIANAGLIAKDWVKRLPLDSTPYTSTIVFLVRKGNPRGIRDWGDLVQPGVSVIAPNPKTSSGGQMAYYAAYGWALDEFGGDEAKARDYIGKLYKNVPVLDSGARGATVTFTQRRVGDVLLAWENEAFLAIKESGADQFEIVVPPESVLAQPSVAVVDEVVDGNGNRKLAEAYLNFLYSDEGQDIAAQWFYRPRSEAVMAKYASRFRPVKLFTVPEKFGSWAAARATHFGEGGVFDQIYRPGAQ
ncbi:MAG TPA: sulfate ABC transporter substrate-binding protein [Alphaproteobacteria bacterium]|nr:sulfate ABC transporter substrate-binding protein [Alphaproteobacteria bacterium]